MHLVGCSNVKKTLTRNVVKIIFVTFRQDKVILMNFMLTVDNQRDKHVGSLNFPKEFQMNFLLYQ